MYRLLVLLLVLSATTCPIWAFEDYYEEPSQKPRGQQNVNYHSNGQLNEGRSGNLRPRQTHTNIHEPTTVGKFIESASSNTNAYYNASGNNGYPDKNKNKRKSQEFANGMIYPPDFDNLSIAMNQIKSRSCFYGLCDEVDDYPVEKIQRILNNSELKKFFSTVKFENRFAETEEGDNLCATVTHTRFPKTAKNIQDKEQVIVNVDQYKQGIEFETCKEEGPCSFAENFPNNFTPKCVQRYTVRKLMIVGKESDDTVFDYFKIPSCCVCVVKK
ncbi:protein spaetzle-like [Anoplophora glabripennis]|uniref:protein spaetzle-like n=1 Tax=Anoplophora glabripennis TaxID=217634 RepID=UPI0008746FE3|nr:protein spaetzle-like [Anoplophora glabripennis]